MDKIQNTSLQPFNGTFGLPPQSYISDEMIINSMPVFEITPCKPNFESGLNLFKVEPDWDSYKSILKKHGYITPTPIKLAFIADNFPTDSFVNDYGETFLQKFTDVASQGMSQMAQMMGADSATEAGRKIGDRATQAAEEMKGGALGKMMATFGSMATGASNQADKLIQSQAVRSLIGGGGDVVNKMVAGHRVDFPQVWRNSSYTPSYTATVRLYNPNPGSDASTKHHIIGPLAAILCLSLPRTDDGNTFNWPFFHQIEAKGIYNLSPSVITNITVVKGGDQQQIAFNQRMGIVDVRIDFISLFNSILLEEKGKGSENRPTLRSYLAALETTGKHSKRSVINAKAANQAGAISTKFTAITPLTKQEKSLVTTKEIIGKRKSSFEIEADKDRIKADEAATSASLIASSPDGLVKTAGTTG